MRAFVTYLLVFFALTCSSQDRHIKFRHLTAEDGLSDNFTDVVFQDSYGFIWIGTRDGLDRYDGYEIKSYRNKENDTTSLAANYVWSIFEDSRKRLWISSMPGGISIYNREKDNFQRIYFEEDFELKNYVGRIIEDDFHFIWVGTAYGVLRIDVSGNKKWFTRAADSTSFEGLYSLSLCKDNRQQVWMSNKQGLFRFNRPSNSFLRIDPVPEDKESVWNGQCWHIMCDSYGFIWLATNRNGLIRYNPRTNTFKQWAVGVNNKVFLSNEIAHIYEDKKQNLWIGSINGGLYLFDRITESFTRFTYDNSNERSINANSISEVTSDSYGNLWISTHGGGVNIINYQENVFKHCKKMSGDPNSLSHNYVSCFYQDIMGNIWIGTDGGGLNLFNRQTGMFTVYNTSNGLKSNAVTSICANDDNSIWVGTWAGGVMLFDIQTRTFTPIEKIIPCEYAKQIQNVKTLCKEDSLLWIGSYRDGLFAADIKHKKIYNSQIPCRDFLRECYSLNATNVLFKDSHGRLWIGTVWGLYMYDGKNFHQYLHKEHDSKTLTDNYINAIYEDHNRKVWIGSLGLDLYDEAHDKFIRFKEKYPTLPRTVKAIAEDDNHRFWISSNEGLYKFSTETGAVKQYTFDDGLQGNQFYLKSSMRSQSGELYFGGTNGFNFFNPNALKDNKTLPEVYINQVKLIFNKKSKTVENLVVVKDVMFKDSLILNYAESRILNIDYLALNPASNSKIEYARRLEGFEDEWHMSGNERRATYTNLSPGTYVFQIKASNNYGYWNNVGDSLTITILSPWWREWWFISLIVLTGILILFGFYRFRVYKIEKEKRDLEHKIEVRTSELNEKKKEAEAHNRDVKSSLTYARRIQDAILPDLKMIREHITDSFAFFAPRDEVSGDFFWYHRVVSPSGSVRIIIASVDCTGHGVPGAFMSMIGNDLLWNIVDSYKITKPSEILYHLHLGLTEKLRTRDRNIADGMDISICVIDRQKQIVEFAGAHNPLVFIRDGQYNVIKGDKYGIGGKIYDNEVERSFTNHTIPILDDQPTWFYIFTDGFEDQFGGPNDKKYLNKRLYEFLLKIHKGTPHDQQYALSDELDNWMGNRDQVDDILIVGFKV